MKVLKFGGTSVGSAERMQNVAKIVQDSGQVLVVLSAVSGTTNSLEAIVNLLKARQNEETQSIIESLRAIYKEYILNLFDDEELKATSNDFVEAHLNDVFEICQQAFVPAFEFHLLAKGELISTELFTRYLKANNQSVALVSALDFLRLDQAGMPDESYLSQSLGKIFKENRDCQVLVTQGFICRNAFGEISNLKRGGSDYSASLFGSALEAEEVQIWTDIDGMHNNDPRFVEGTRPIRELSFDEAAELAYFGAKILHPSSIKPTRKKSIPVRLLNTMEPSASGTLISTVSPNARIKAVAAKDGITAIKIKSSEMLQAPGFLRRIFEVFELYHTSIDVITTSEVAVSVTIDTTDNLAPIVKTLEEFGRVEVDENLSIICVVGAFVMESKGIAAQVIQAVEDIPLRMISYGGSAHNITMLVSEDLKVQALNALHRGLFDV